MLTALSVAKRCPAVVLYCVMVYLLSLKDQAGLSKACTKKDLNTDRTLYVSHEKGSFDKTPQGPTETPIAEFSFECACMEAVNLDSCFHAVSLLEQCQAREGSGWYHLGHL